MENNLGKVFDWDGVIQNDSPEFVTLPAGDYVFEVLKIEKARHNGSAKLPPCPKAIVTLAIEGEQGRSIFKHNLFLHSATEGMLCAFFTAIGLRKHGEPLQMNWSVVTGCKGRAKIDIRTWVSDKGNDCAANEVKQFYDFDESKMAKESWIGQPNQPNQPQVAQTTYQQPMQQPVQQAYQQPMQQPMNGTNFNSQNPMPATGFNGFSLPKEDDPF